MIYTMEQRGARSREELLMTQVPNLMESCENNILTFQIFGIKVNYLIDFRNDQVSAHNQTDIFGKLLFDSLEKTNDLDEGIMTRYSMRLSAFS